VGPLKQGVQGEEIVHDKINSFGVQNKSNGVPNLNFPPSSGLEDYED